MPEPKGFRCCPWPNLLFPPNGDDPGADVPNEAEAVPPKADLAPPNVSFPILPPPPKTGGFSLPPPNGDGLGEGPPPNGDGFVFVFPPTNGLGLVFMFFLLLYHSISLHQSKSFWSILRYPIVSGLSMLGYMVMGYGLSFLIVSLRG